ncbi:MAG: phenylalanine--tRNA ligase subunit beta [Kiritimatiellales bacterium]
MKFTLSWLKEYVDFDDTVEGLADRLTFAGLEVEKIETVGGMFDGVVAGKILAVEPHPDADKLRLCSVDYGAGATLKVVCGAPNVETGGVYPFAPVGTVLRGEKLKKAKIRGVESLGMLCAADELGLSNDHSGLMVLNPGTVPGTPLTEIIGAPETVFELEITPNRPDCLSVIGIAREVAAIYGAPLKIPVPEIKESTAAVEKYVSVEVQDTGKCPRYTAHVLKNIQIAPAPEWMQKRLNACGIRSINNVVDITNYVLLETGHPLHAFDYTLLQAGKIIVRNAGAGEKFITLDGTERVLNEHMTVIADTEKAIALGGIMGGLNTEINDHTKTVLLEAAVFEKSNIRATVKALGLSTDSSYRFQRGVNAESVEWASRRAAALMQDFAGAELCAGVLDAYAAPKTRRQITVHWHKICDLIGLGIPAGTQKEIFESLGISVLESDTEKALLEIPAFRDDLEREVDLSEEVIRLYGVDKIPEKMPDATTISGVSDARIRAIHACHKNLAGLGAREIMNYTLVNHALLDLFGKENYDAREELPHPISSDQSVLRTSLIPQMVESLGRNKSRQINEALFFESGRTFIKTEQGTKQVEKICIGLMGTAGRGALDKQRPVTREETFLHLKGLLENLFAAQKLVKVQFRPLDKAPEFSAGTAVEITAGKRKIGVLGLINDAARKEWRLNDPVAAAEIDLEALIENVWRRYPVKDIPLYPSIDRDFAFIVDEQVKHEEIVKAARSAAPAELETITLFDLFRGKPLEQGKKSMAYNFIYRSPAGTLTDERVNAFHDIVGKNVCEATGAAIREG